MLLLDLYKIRYLLLIELFLLVVFAFFELIPLLILAAILFSGIIFYLTFEFPIIGVHLLIFSIIVDSFIPFKDISKVQSIAVVEIVFIFLLVLSSLRYLLSFEKQKAFPFLILVWIPFLVWAISIGSFVAIDKIRVLSYWKNHFAGFFAFSLTYYVIKNPKQLKSVIIGIIVWGVALSLLQIKVLFELGGFTKGIVGLFLKKNLLTIGWGRSNYLAAFFVIIIPFTIGYLLYIKSRAQKAVLLLALLIMFFSLILTLSRGGILSLLIALFILITRVVKTKTLIPFAIVVIIIVVVVLANPLTLVLIDRISSLDASLSFYTRLNYYEDAWNTFLKYPFTGVGFGNISYYATFILAPEASPSAHNIVLGMLGEVGIFGSIFYFTILFVILKFLYNSYKMESSESLRILKWASISSVIGGYLHSLMEPTLEGLQFSIIFWTLVALSSKLDLLDLSKSKNI